MNEHPHNGPQDPRDGEAQGAPGASQAATDGRGLLWGRPLRMAAVAILAVALAVGGVRFWNYFHSYASTEDAEIEANISPISSRIEGTVTRVYVDNTQFVKAGQLLVTLDPRDYRVAVEKARADLDQAEAQTQSARSNYTATRSQLNEAQANNVKAQSDARRYAALREARVTTSQQYDKIIAAARVARATVEADRASAAATEKLVAVRQAGVLAAKAALDQALLNLGYTKIYAPVSGVVGAKTVQTGERVQPGQGLLAITQLNDLWVTANFKETSIGQIRAGQRATIYVDALGRDLTGHVVGLSGATGALYSLLPPENATGNWIKVVQRLPIRIRFDKGQDPPSDHLRPGLSVEVKVWLR
jgi:membrane fusion protein, multidrug efflux system